MYYCAYCENKYCYKGELDKISKNCPCNEKEMIENVKELYLISENHKLAYNSALVESEGYCKKTRLEEIISFSHRCGYKKLGIAFCVGLSNEARVLAEVLSASITKEQLGIKEEEKVRPNTREAICNPIMQALLLNKAKTELNIMLGLCVGHDSLFIKYSTAPITVFAVKDRVLAHNPLGAIYLANSYYKKKIYK